MAAITLARLSDVTSAVLASHGARVKRAAGNFSVGNNVLTAVDFTAEDYDTDTMHDNATNPSRLVIPTITGVTTGLWGIRASGYATGTTTLYVDVMFRKGAAGNPAAGTVLAFTRFNANAAGINGYVLAADAVLSAAEYVECFLRTTAGAGSAAHDADVSPLFEIAFLGKVT